MDEMEGSIKGLDILFQNEACLVVNKKAGLSVQGGKGIKVSVESLLTEFLQGQDPGLKPFLVHRLDRDTSGLLVVALNRSSASELSTLFGRASLKRLYLGICAGTPREARGVIRTELDGQYSETFYTVKAGGDFSLLELELGTGRMHQIRRHLAQIGHPLLGDSKYGNFALNREQKKTRGLRELLLHAHSIILPPSALFPRGLECHSPMPDYFTPYLDR